MPEVSNIGSEGQRLLGHRLPPSFGVTKSYFDSWYPVPRPWSPIPLPRAAITYSLRALITVQKSDGLDTANSITVKAKKDIWFVPYTEAEPPTYLLNFPGEFTPRVERQLRKSILGGSLGTLTVIAEEPIPLTYALGEPKVSTDCVVRLLFSGPCLTLQRLHKLSFNITTILRAKTYYSVKAIPAIPKQTLLTDSGLLRLHDDVLKLEESRFQALDWTWFPPADGVESDTTERSTLCSQNNRSGSVGSHIRFQANALLANAPHYPPQ